MPASLIGFQIEDPNPAQVRRDEVRSKQFVPDSPDDGALEQAPGFGVGNAYGTVVDLEGSAKNETALINRYRTMAQQPECDSAVDDIVNEAIDQDWKSSPIELNMDQSKASQRIKDAISQEFDYILKLLDFQKNAYDMFRRWYIDGRLYYQIVINYDDPSMGIQKLVFIDPRKIRKVRKQRVSSQRVPDNNAQVPLFKKPLEFYIYNPGGMGGQDINVVHEQRSIKIAKDSVALVTSGIVDPGSKLVLSHLHKALKPLNNLRHMEDSSVIYRLARAPERRIFYIDVGNLPKPKAEQYVRDMMTRYKNRLVYDATTGNIRDDRRFLTMLEDFWLPRREGNRGTEISTLPGGENLGQITDIEYFEQKLYRALNVPISRLNSDEGFNLGRPSEITRDEVKFNKFIKRLRQKFSELFDTILERQLILKNVMNSSQWEVFREDIAYDFRSDNYFTEFKNSEINRERFESLQTQDQFVGKYVSKSWVMKNTLRMTDEEISRVEDEIATEIQSGEIATDMAPGSVPPEDGAIPPGGAMLPNQNDKDS